MKTPYLLSALLLMAILGRAQAKLHTDDIQTVQVTGEATVSAAPDEAEVTIGIVSEAPAAQEAPSASNHRTESVIQALRQRFGSKLDLKTSSYSLSPTYASKPSEQGTPAIRAYRATMLIELTMHQLNELGAAIDLAMQSGANSIQGLRFDCRDHSKLDASALRLAAANARDDADVLASALNLKVVRILSMTEAGGPVRPVEPRFTALAAGVPIEPGNLDVTAVVTMEAEISSK